MRFAFIHAERQHEPQGQLLGQRCRRVFFATLKKALIHRHSWTSRSQLRESVFAYLEVFYNRRRLHSFLDYKTPAEFEADATAALTACQPNRGTPRADPP